MSRREQEGVAHITRQAAAREAAGRFAIVRAMFYEDLAARLTDSAIRTLTDAGIDHGSIHCHDVPGAFELPLAAQACAESHRYAGVVCLGAVIRGETDHYEYVSEAAAQGIARVQLDTGIPCAFGVLTVDSMEQAIERTNGGKRDQGADAARTALRMSQLLDRIRAPEAIAPGRMH
jgi:6,7-dimethyl-8-ribityllumazine synthase